MTRLSFLGAPYDLAPLADVLASLAQRRGGEPFRYIVTPNVDHVVRLRADPGLRPLYEGAWQSWCDSHIVRRIGFAFGLRLPHLNGTDVVEHIFAEVLKPGDRIALIAARPEIVTALAARFPSLTVVGHCPPMDFFRDAQAVEACLQFAQANPARFLFLAVGSPQSERLAHLMAGRAGMTGTGLCIGAAIEFIAGMKPRAPKAVQNLGFEWLHRLISEPRRLWRRYVLGIAPLLVLVGLEARNRFRS